jgi:putative DNA methylase
MPNEFGPQAQGRAEADGEEADTADEDDEEDAVRPGRRKGLVLVYDVVRRFAQPLGIHLDQWERLFGDQGAMAVAQRIEISARTARGTAQGTLLPELAGPPAPAPVKGGRKSRGAQDAVGGDLETRRDATTLDRVHAAIFQASGASNALRALLEAEIGRGPEFLRLANALSALYPKDSEEKRLFDAMLVAVPR